MSDKDIFQTILYNSGIQFKDGKWCSEFSYIEIKRSFVKNCELNDNQQRNDLIESLMNCFNNFDKNDILSFPNLISDINCQSTSRFGNESIVKLLFEVDFLQPLVISALIEKLPEFSDEQDDENPCTLILNQLKWINRITDEKSLSNKIIEALQTCPIHIQSEVIGILPEIFGDLNCEELIDELISLMKQEDELISIIIDTVSNLNIKSNQMKVIQECILEKLASVKLNTLPIIIKFLLQSKDPDLINASILSLRQDLDIQALSLDDDFKNTEVVIIESLKSGIRMNEEFVKIFIKNVKDPHISLSSIIDFWILIIIYSISTKYKQKIETIFKKKIISDKCKLNFLRKLIKNYKNSLKDHFKALLSFAHLLIQNSSNSTLRKYGEVMYFELFISFNEQYYQQEIITNILSHIGSSSNDEIDSSLDIIIKLIENHNSSINKFSSYTQSLLDYIDNSQLKTHQIKKIYQIFTLLAYSNDKKNTNSYRSQLNILLTKQLINPEIKYKLIGVIGVSILISRIGSKSYWGIMNEEDRDHSFRRINELIPKAMDIKVSSVLAHFFDELSCVIKKTELIDEVLELILSNITSKFTNFMLTVPDAINISSIKCIMLGLNEESDIEDAPCLNLYSAITYNNETMTKNLLCPTFKLLQTTTFAIKKDRTLEDINAVLGCPILMHENVDDEEFIHLTQSQREERCKMILHCSNWFIELMNAWALSPNTQDNLREKLLTRANQLYDLLISLYDKMLNTPTFLPPEKKTRSKSNQNNSKLFDLDVIKSIQKVKNYLRSFDIETLNIIKSNEDEEVKTKLSQGALIILLFDLNEKISYILGINDSNQYLNPPEWISIYDSNIECFKNMKSILIFIGKMTKSLISINEDNSMERVMLNILLSIYKNIFKSEFIYNKDEDWIDIQDIVQSLIENPKLKDNLSKEKLLLQTYKYFESLLNQGNYNLDTSMLIIDILHSIISKCPNKNMVSELSVSLSKLAISMLKKDWNIDFDDDEEQSHDISSLIEMSIQLSNDPIGVMYHLSIEVLSKEDSISEYKILNKSNLKTLIKIIMNESTNKFTNISLSDLNVSEKLLEMKALLSIHNSLINIVKHERDRKLFAITMQNAKSIISSFGKKCTWFSSHLKSYKNDIFDVMTEYQLYIRPLCNIFTYLKDNLDKALSKNIAPIKKLMESVIFKVEEMMKENDMINSFHIGTLQNRSLDDEIIPSQKVKEENSRSKRKRSNTKKKGNKRKKSEEEDMEPVSDIHIEMDDIDDDEDMNNAYYEHPLSPDPFNLFEEE